MRSGETEHVAWRVPHYFNKHLPIDFLLHCTFDLTGLERAFVFLPLWKLTYGPKGRNKEYQQVAVSFIFILLTLSQPSLIQI